MKIQRNKHCCRNEEINKCPVANGLTYVKAFQKSSCAALPYANLFK